MSASTPAVLGRTSHAEWTRLWTVRSTWWFAMVTALVVLGIGTILGFDVHDNPREHQPETAWEGGQVTSMFGLFGVLALAVVCATGDHATGGIVPTLQATPRRGVLFTSRVAVIALTTTLLGVLLVLGASVIVNVFAPETGLPVEVGSRVLGTVAFVYATGALLSVGLGLLTRSTPGALVSVIALMLVLPILLGNLPYEFLQDLAARLPGASAMYLLVREGMPGITDESARITLGLWALVSVTAGGSRLMRSDADR